MADAVIIELPERIAGIAVRDGNGYRFYASHSLFRTIDTRRFRHVASIRAAAAKLLGSASAQESQALRRF